MYKSPLLQTPLPHPTRPLPDIWLVTHEVTNRDEVLVGVCGCGTVLVPDMVREAMEELASEAYRLGEGNIRILRAQHQTIILLLTCRYEERGYVEYEAVPSSATPLQSAASGSA